MPTLEVVADHTLLLALPAFAPAVVVVGFVIYVAMKDRRNSDEDDDDVDDRNHSEDSASADEDGSP